MGRPKLPSGEARKVYHLRLSDSELTSFKNSALKDGVPLPQWMRKALTMQANDTNRTT